MLLLEGGPPTSPGTLFIYVSDLFFCHCSLWNQLAFITEGNENWIIQRIQQVSKFYSSQTIHTGLLYIYYLTEVKLWDSLYTLPYPDSFLRPSTCNKSTCPHNRHMHLTCQIYVFKKKFGGGVRYFEENSVNLTEWREELTFLILKFPYILIFKITFKKYILKEYYCNFFFIVWIFGQFSLLCFATVITDVCAVMGVSFVTHLQFLRKCAIHKWTMYLVS